MRKSLIVIQMSMIFLAFACPAADAAITWDAAYNIFHYGAQDSGQFYNNSTNPPYYNPSGYAGAPEDSTYSATSSATLTELTGAISLNATAAGPVGGVSPADGLQVRTFAEIVPSNWRSWYGIDVAQNVVSYVTRRFRVTTGVNDPWRPYNVRAELSGVVDFYDFYNSSSWQGTHSVQGTVELYESIDNFNQDFRMIHSWPLNESTRTISANVIFRTDANARYELKIGLTLNSRLANMAINPQSGSIGISGLVPSANYKMGTVSTPLALNAIIFDLSEAIHDDGIPPARDKCPTLYDPAQTDTDGDSVGDVCDNCPSVSNSNQLDSDGDHVGNACDGCPTDPLKIAPGVCGCGVADTDSDRDGTPDCHDDCLNDPFKIAPGVCGCGYPDTDSDNDGMPDCNDLCPNDPLKTAPGVCGCGVPDTDTDLDGIPNCNDQCPNDPLKIAPGVCGCGRPDTDSDGDGILNCNDLCPNDPGKTDPGICGCGRPDQDTNGDGIVDCPNKTLNPGIFILLLDE